jgi:hypothetical protein
MSSLPTALVAGQLAPLISGDQAIAAAPEGLLEALAEVPDPRDARGIRYGLAPGPAAPAAADGGPRSATPSPACPPARPSPTSSRNGSAGTGK